MFLVVPLHVDVPMRRRPWMNWVLIGATVLLYPLCLGGYDFTPLGYRLMLGGTSWLGVVGHVFVHADTLHLLGNMIFLWVFGNAVCAKVGNLAYLFLYLGMGTAAGLVAYAIDPSPAVGASGAINGVIGMFVWYFLNELSCWYVVWFVVGKAGVVQVSSYWLVLVWLAFDVWGAARGVGNVGHLAHLAGLATGFGLAVLLLRLRWVRMDEGERSLVQVLPAGRA